MSAYSLDFPDHTFDTVTLIEALEQLERPGAALAEIARVLQPGGQLYITTPNRLWPIEQHGLKVRGTKRPGYWFPGLVWIAPLHRRVSDAAAFRSAEIRRLGRAAGFSECTVTWMMPPMDMKGNPAVRGILDRAERTPARIFGQTIVVRLVTPTTPA
ncbi:MAG: methyltransferase domain-containing protein [Acidimicrobiia bacterium]|nr:methyltransferase domain-containing protein [Acidimicrobiia bacterium]